MAKEKIGRAPGTCAHGFHVCSVKGCPATLPGLDGAESFAGLELSARLHENEEHATLDCGCVLTNDEDGENVAALYKCPTCDAAPELRRVLRALLGAFDACAMAGRGGVSPAQAIKQRDEARELLRRVKG